MGLLDLSKEFHCLQYAELIPVALCHSWRCMYTCGSVPRSDFIVGLLLYSSFTLNYKLLKATRTPPPHPPFYPTSWCWALKPWTYTSQTSTLPLSIISSSEFSNVCIVFIIFHFCNSSNSFLILLVFNSTKNTITRILRHILQSLTGNWLICSLRTKVVLCFQRPLWN